MLTLFGAGFTRRMTRHSSRKLNRKAHAGYRLLCQTSLLQDPGLGFIQDGTLTLELDLLCKPEPVAVDDAVAGFNASIAEAAAAAAAAAAAVAAAAAADANAAGAESP